MHNKFSYLAGIAAFLLSWSQYPWATQTAWNLNDVSYLFPLPHGDSKAPAGLLAPLDEGAGGPLLPEAVYSRIPTLQNAGNGNETLYRNALRVISMRIDPCPQLDSTSCSPELRLVWQPVEFDRFAEKWTARDAAVHCVYTIPGPDFARLRDNLWAVKRKYENHGVSTSRAPLDVHPALSNKATAESFQKDIQSIILRHAGSRHLSRVTFTALRVPTRWWRFGGIEKDDHGQWTPTRIPRIDARTVDIFNVAVAEGGLGKDDGIDAIFNVLPEEYPESDNLFRIINKGYRFNDDRDLPVFRDKLDAVARFRNPHRSNTGNLDCASCHYADAARYYAANRFPQLSEFRSAERFENPDPADFNLDNNTVATTSTRTVRAFGYLDDEPSISQRTIHDSAASAHWLNTMDRLAASPQ